MFQPPANQDDLADRPDLKKDFLDLWNRRSTDLQKTVYYMGDYATIAAGNPNYVDPRDEAAIGTAAAVPWNGFPRLLSRYYQDSTSESARTRAEEVADILTPVVYWFVEEGGRLNLRSALVHQLALHVTPSLRLPELQQIARPLRELLPNNTVGKEIAQFRRQQDEYLEWHADHNADGSIRRIIFTAEPPDYWEALAEVAPERVVDLYREHVDPSVERIDLFYPDRVAIFGRFANGKYGWVPVNDFAGRYNPLNAWTTTKGIMHLTHGANTLGAEVRLAGDASIRRQVDTLKVTPGQDPAPEIMRIACGGYGGINRSSDPNIGYAVGRQVQAGNRITLTDPVGLYIARIDLSGLKGPDGQALGDAAGRPTRGVDDPFEPRILRYEIKLPEGSAFTLSDCHFDNRQLIRGGQIAREATIQLYVNTYPGSASGEPAGCDGRPCRHPDNAEVFGIGDSHGNCAPASSASWLLSTPYEDVDTQGAGLTPDASWQEPESTVVTSHNAEVPPKKGYDWSGWSDQL